MEEENQQRPESPSSPSPQDELLRKDKDYPDEEKSSIDSNKSDKFQKASLKIRSKKRKTSTSPQNGDCESQNSFSRTSSTCGYRESFGMRPNKHVHAFFYSLSLVFLHTLHTALDETQFGF